MTEIENYNSKNDQGNASTSEASLHFIYTASLPFFFKKQQLQITATLNYYVSTNGFLGNSLFRQPSLNIYGKVKMKTMQVLL